MFLADFDATDEEAATIEALREWDELTGLPLADGAKRQDSENRTVDS
jgi:hypothetical protein